MYYYSLSILGSPLEPLTYHSKYFLQSGSLVSTLLSKRNVNAVVLCEVEKPDFPTQDIISIFDFLYSAIQIKISQFMAEYYGTSLGDALNLFIPFQIDSNTNNTILNQFFTHFPVEITLSFVQSEALNFIRNHSVSLLFGDTGAGKSEIYMKRMDEILGAGKRVLLLLPEISLTPQMQQRFQKHFGELFVLWHSKMTPKQKK